LLDASDKRGGSVIFIYSPPTGLADTKRRREIRLVTVGQSRTDSVVEPGPLTNASSKARTKTIQLPGVRNKSTSREIPTALVTGPSELHTVDGNSYTLFDIAGSTPEASLSHGKKPIATCKSTRK